MPPQQFEVESSCFTVTFLQTHRFHLGGSLTCRVDGWQLHQHIDRNTC